MRKTIIYFIIILALLVGAISINVWIYNKGECRICGGQMMFTDVEYSKNDNKSSTAHYLYKCEDCGHMIELRLNPRGILDFIF